MGGTDAARRIRRARMPAGDIIDHVLSLACFELAMDVAYVSRFAPRRLEVQYLAGDGRPFGLARGGSVPLGRTYCARMASGALPNVVRDTHVEPATAALGFTRELGIRAYAGVAIRLPDERPIGSIACLSAEPRPRLGSRNTDLLDLLGRHVGEEIDRRMRERAFAVADAAAHESEFERMPLILRGITSELSGSAFGGRLVDMPLYQVNAVLSGRLPASPTGVAQPPGARVPALAG